MTGKEALKNIVENTEPYRSIPYFSGWYKKEDYFKWIKLIYEDLEILEIFKKLPFEIYQNGGGDNFNWFIDTKQSFKITEEEAIKLREWLRNEQKKM